MRTKDPFAPIEPCSNTLIPRSINPRTKTRTSGGIQASPTSPRLRTQPRLSHTAPTWTAFDPQHQSPTWPSSHRRNPQQSKGGASTKICRSHPRQRQHAVDRPNGSATKPASPALPQHRHVTIEGRTTRQRVRAVKGSLTKKNFHDIGYQKGPFRRHMRDTW